MVREFFVGRAVICKKLILNPTKSARISPTAGENVRISSVKGFISDVFG